MVGFCFVRSLLCIDPVMVFGVHSHHLWSRFQSLMLIVAVFDIFVTAYLASILRLDDLVLGHSCVCDVPSSLCESYGPGVSLMLALAAPALAVGLGRCSLSQHRLGRWLWQLSR